MKLILFTRKMFPPSKEFTLYLIELSKKYEEIKKFKPKVSSKEELNSFIKSIQILKSDLVNEELQEYYNKRYYVFRYLDKTIYI